MGDSINRKILDHVEFLTSEEQLAEYIRKFRFDHELKIKKTNISEMKQN